VPATQLKASETIARQVVQTIVNRGLGPGDMLPREADMLAEYGVSRETLREALRLLEVQGLITLRRGPGGGPVVGAARPVHLGRVSTLYFQMIGATYNELFEAWVFGEGTLAERAARNPDAELRAATMAPYIEPVDHDDHENVASFMLTHVGFHEAVGALGNNRVLDLTLTSFGQIVTYQAGVIEDPRILRTQLYEDHRELARAISAGHNRAARQLMEEHIGAVLEYFRDHFDGRLDDAIEWL
jgi:DNA-binding FadR family transcriptional regulator